MPRDGVYDVPFGYEALDRIAALHDQRGDAVLAHPVCGALNRVGRADCEDLGAFVVQNILNHDHSLYRWR